MLSELLRQRPLDALTAVRGGRRLALLLVLLAVTCPAPAWAQARSAAESENIAVDPIRCWWRTSTGAVRVGEVFDIVLTCAVLETDEVQVTADESKLNPAAVQLTPFEVVEGSHPADLRTGQRRFFQYAYRTRVLSPDLIGRDVPLPGLTVLYRVNSRMNNATTQGRDLTYIMPVQSIKVASLVPADTRDIRDTADENFGRIESFSLRASALDIAAVAFGALGALMLVVTFVGVARGAGWKFSTKERQAGDRSVLGRAAGELAAVQREAEQQGWSEPLLGRALAAVRLAAAFALDRPVSQLRQTDSEEREGSVILRRWGRSVAVSSPVTGEDVANELARMPATAPAARRQMLETLHAAMESFAKALYGQRGAVDGAPLEGVISSAIGVVRTLRTERLMPQHHLRRWRPGTRTRPLAQRA